MIETLNATTMVGVPIISTAGSSILTDTATNYKTDDDGNITESKLVPKGIIASSLVTAGTTGSCIAQQASENRAIKEIQNQQVNATIEYVSSLPQEQLEALLIGLGELEVPINSSDKPKSL